MNGLERVTNHPAYVSGFLLEEIMTTHPVWLARRIHPRITVYGMRYLDSHREVLRMLSRNTIRISTLFVVVQLSVRLSL